jgi:hypothetical protein
MPSPAAAIAAIIIVIFLASALTKIYPQISPSNQVIAGSIFPTQGSSVCSNNPFPKFEPAAVYEPINAPAGKGGYTTNLLAGSLLANAKTNFVFRGYFWWNQCPGWWPWTVASQVGGNSNIPCTYQGHLQSLSALSDYIKLLKQKNPNLIFAGGITTSHLESKDIWANGTVVGSNYDSMCAHTPKGEIIDFYNGCIANFSNPQWRQFVIGWANKIVDAGVDAIWFDQICMYEKLMMNKGVGDVDDVLSDCANNFAEIAQAVRLHASQSGRTVLVAFNWNAEGISSLYNKGHGNGLNLLFQNVDYVMASTNPADFNTTAPYVLTEDWPTVKKAVGNLPVITYLDWSGQCDWCQLYKFAQLSKQNQINYLTDVDAGTKKNGIIFAYPMWGGSDQMYTDRYDSVRDGTYDTIAQLSNSTIPCSTTSTTTTISTTSTTTPLATSSTTTTTTAPPKQRISVSYIDITTKASDDRDAIQLLTPIQPDYIWRAYWKWGGTSDAQHQAYKQKIAEIKNAIPGVNVGGFLPLQFLSNGNNADTWPNGSVISNADFKSMILYGGDGNPIPDYAGYYPDPRSKLFQDYLADWAKKEKEAGVDIMHFDGQGIVISAAYTHGAITNLHAFDESFKTIFERTGKEAGLSVESNNPPIGSTNLTQYGFYSVWSNQDIIDGQLWKEDLNKPFTLHENYTRVKEDMKILYGKEIPLNVHLDYAAGSSNSPLSKFAALSIEDKKAFMKMIDADTKANGASFIYPVYGGDYVNPNNPLDRGKFDSVEQGIYDTIVELATSQQPITTTTSPTTTTTTIQNNCNSLCQNQGYSSGSCTGWFGYCSSNEINAGQDNCGWFRKCCCSGRQTTTTTLPTTTSTVPQKDLYDPFPDNDNAYGFYCVLNKPKLYGFKYSIWEFQKTKKYKSVFELFSDSEKYENHKCDFPDGCPADELQFDKNILDIRSPLPSASLRRSESLILLNIDYPEKSLYLNLTLKRGPIHYWSSNNFDSMDSVLEGKITLNGSASDVKGLCTFAHWYTTEDFRFSNKMSFYDEVFWNWSYSSDVWIVTSLKNVTTYYTGGTTLTDGNHKLFQPSQIIFNYSETTPEGAPKGWTVITESGLSYKSKVLSTNSPPIVNLNGTQIALNLFLTSSELSLNGKVYYGFGLTEFPAPTSATTTTISQTTTTTIPTATSTTVPTTTTPQTSSSTITPVTSTTITSTTATFATLITTTTINSGTTTTPQTASSTTTTTITPPAQPCKTYDIPCWIGYFILRIFGLMK